MTIHITEWWQLILFELFCAATIYLIARDLWLSIKPRDKEPPK